MKTNLWSVMAVLMMETISGSTMAQETVVHDAMPDLLVKLSGDWKMTGDVRGKPVSYRLHAETVLNKTFIELHMMDVGEPPAYEARVFIGFDPKTQHVIAHWIDSFGAAFSIPPGIGRIDGNQIEFEIPYPDGPFKDTFAYAQHSDAWTLNIESVDGTGAWKHFASYTIGKDTKRSR